MKMGFSYNNPIVDRLGGFSFVKYSARKYSKATDDRQPDVTCCIIVPVSLINI
jgi:hypothetical protein